MRDNQIGGLPVVEGPQKKIVGNVSIRDIRHLLLKPQLFTSFRYNAITAISYIDNYERYPFLISPISY